MPSAGWTCADGPETLRRRRRAVYCRSPSQQLSIQQSDSCNHGNSIKLYLCYPFSSFQPVHPAQHKTKDCSVINKKYQMSPCVLSFFFFCILNESLQRQDMLMFILKTVNLMQHVIFFFYILNKKQQYFFFFSVLHWSSPSVLLKKISPINSCEALIQLFH